VIALVGLPARGKTCELPVYFRLDDMIPLLNFYCLFLFHPRYFAQTLSLSQLDWHQNKRFGKITIIFILMSMQVNKINFPVFHFQPLMLVNTGARHAISSNRVLANSSIQIMRRAPKFESNSLKNPLKIDRILVIF